MSEDSKTALQASKCANIIMAICELYDVSIHEATDIFYKSDTSELIEKGVADLQCRSDKYLASVIWDESKEQAND